ncbi:hypothetical protein CQW23_16308 [Capsicum baccatum]|uniref:Uncharacterized protein n=1 Tax=Capsicum baccatum TaxID=33114 RepID=A0A2G2WAL3_CAPBA|nr:hypothetical protein CQW23_16308 [Capsicum baccatum]
MANARIARFVTEVAPPQFVNVMRNRASKMLETIKEEEREASMNESLSLKSYSPPSSTSAYLATSESLSLKSYTSPSSTSAYSASSSNSKYFLKEVQRSFSVFGS